MRKLFHPLLFSLTMLFFMVLAEVSLAQAPPPPPPPPPPPTTSPKGSSTNNQPGPQPQGGGAPIGNGLGILLVLGVSYGIYKLYAQSKEKQLA